MPDPLEYRSPSEDRRDQVFDDSAAVRRFRITVTTITIVSNAILLIAAINDVFPKGRTGAHGFLAALIGYVFSPVINFVIIALSLGLESSLFTRRTGWGRLVIAPLTGLIVNFAYAIAVLRH